MPTTTNYGWTTPADTDLVKDGAAAIRSLGTAIDTTTYNNAQAAIAKTIVDAKGDIIAATANDTVSRLAVGANNTVLTADSSTATGLKWSAISSSPASASATVATKQSTSSTSYTNLATTGPSVTLTTGTKVLVIVSCTQGSESSASEVGRMDFDISGATTRATSNDTMLSLYQDGSVNSYLPRASSVTYQTVTAGSNTFTAKYRSAGGGSIAFSAREITVIDLGS